MNTFSATIYQNEYLPAGGTEMQAIVTVEAEPSDAPAVAAASRAEVLLVDVSGSMAQPKTKIAEARAATAAAVDCIGDGVPFAIVAGTAKAQQVYPRTGLVPASPETRADARAAIAGLVANGGTAIGTWLLAANDLFATVPGGINHAILLTDGVNESETDDDFALALSKCEGNFQCECRGVGTDWRVDELRMIASALLGGVDIIARPEEMRADFISMMEQAQRKDTADVQLRVWVPQDAQMGFVKQVAPTIADLTNRGVAVDALTRLYPTGAWSTESRDYHICVRFPPREVGDEMLAARVGVVVNGEIVCQALLRASWTENQALSTRIDGAVAHYTGQAEIADAIQGGLDAHARGDKDGATVLLGRATQLAAESGNDDTLKLLGRVVDIEDAETGTVRLKAGAIDKVAEMTLDTRSTRTVRINRSQP